MADLVKTIKSSIKLKNKETGVVSTVTVEESSENNDFKLKIRPSSSIFVTEARLDKYVFQMDNFLQNPTILNAIKTPSIMSVEKKDDCFHINLSNFSSPALLRYASTRVQFCLDTEFENGENANSIVDILYHNFDKPELVIVPFSKLKQDTTYYVRACYGASGIESEWGFPFSVSYSKPTIDKPKIESLELSYTTVYPFKTTLLCNTSPFTPKNTEKLESCIYRIYREENDGTSVLRKTITVKPNELNNPNANLIEGDLFPNLLEHGLNYSITVEQRDTSGGYSEESDKRYFNSRGIILTPVENIKSYPSYINISNPKLAFNDDFYYLVNNQKVLVKQDDIEAVYWTIENETVSRPILKFTIKNSVILDLPENSLEPNMVYKVSVYYTHKLYGSSQVASTRIQTRTFERMLDLLDKPVKIHNSIGYFGEIPYSKLIPENIKYQGDYIKGKVYYPGDEVTVLNENTNTYDLYVCKKGTVKSEFVFFNHFEDSSIQAGKDIYKSGLPTAKYLLDNIGVGKIGNRLNETSGWIKLQNKEGKLIYLTKLHVLDNVSVNDLIKTELWHPRKKTIRLHNSLYYVRLLIDSIYPGYDSLDPNYEYREYYVEEAVSNLIEPNESDIIRALVNGSLYDYSTTSIGFTDSTIKELSYGTEYPLSFVPRRANGIMELAKEEVSGIDDKFYSIRLVLEYIPEDEYPVYNISSRIPGQKFTKEEIKTFYRFHADTCYLGYVTNDDFINSETIDNQTGLYSNKTVINRGWHRFYHKGLLYFLSDGTNIREIEIEQLDKFNLIKDYKMFKIDPLDKDVKLGKVKYNNLIFNVSCPKVLNNYRQAEVVFNKNEEQVNIFGDTFNKGLEISKGSFFGDAVLNIFKKSVFENQDRVGNKGEFYTLNEFVNISNSKDEEDKAIIGIDQIGSASKEETDAYFMTSNTTEIERRFILNLQHKPNNITFVDGLQNIVDVVFVLTICPTIDNKKIWK